MNILKWLLIIVAMLFYSMMLFCNILFTAYLGLVSLVYIEND